jgi:hypothetical protein
MKAKINVSREAMASLFRHGAYAIEDGLMDKQRLVSLEYDHDLDCYWLVFDDGDRQDIINGRPTELMPVKMLSIKLVPLTKVAPNVWVKAGE